MSDQAVVPARSGNPKVIFVAGWLRSGSTLLAKLLDQIPGFLSLGEVYFLWDQGLLQKRFCGCSRAFDDCPFWSRIARSFLQEDWTALIRIVRARDRLRSRHFWRLLLPRGRRWLAKRADEYRGTLERFYRNLPVWEDTPVVVDVSKFSSHGFALGQVDDIDLTVVHLVRDPRAVAFSWSRKRDYWKFHYSPFRSAVHWTTQNLLTECLWNLGAARQRYLRIRYEDFVKDPQGTLRAIGKRVGEEVDLGFFVDQRRADFKPTHTIAGNPSRFIEGEIEIKPDNEWCKSIRARDYALVTLLTWPLLVRYGYQLRPASEPRRSGALVEVG